MVMLYIILMSNSSFMFLANDLSFAVYFIFILDHRNDVRQKANSRDFFLFKLKLGHKAEEITHNNKNASGPGTAKERTVQWWFKQFCKGDKTFENEALNGQLSEVDNDQFRGSLKLILLQLHKKLPRKSISAILWSFSI